jgi:hypothetical protein
MNRDFLVFAPNIILLVLFVIYLWLWRRRSLKEFDWVTFGCMLLGISLLTIVILLILKNHPSAGPVQILLIAVPTLVFVLFLLFLTRIVKVEKVQSKFHLDERINEINAKSARNALISVYLGVLINILIYSSISTELLLEIIGVSLAVYLASLAIYYYRTF